MRRAYLAAIINDATYAGIISHISLRKRRRELTVTMPAGMNLRVRRNLGPIMRTRTAQTAGQAE
jgi:hypothetical protein